MEKKKIVNWIWVIGYCIPFTFIGLLIDCLKGKLTGYWFMLAGILVLFIVAMLLKKTWVAFVGNVVSAAISYGLSLIFLKPEDWTYYIVIMTPQGMILTMAALLLAVQVILWSSFKKRGIKKNKTTA